MTTIAVGFAAEQFIPALGSVRIEVDARARFHGRQRKLIKLQSRQFAGDLILVGIYRDVAEPGLCGDGKLIAIIEPLVEKGADPVQFVDSHERVPVRNYAPTARPGVQIVARSAATLIPNARGLAAVGLKRFAVEEQFDIEFARAP